MRDLAKNANFEFSDIDAAIFTQVRLNSIHLVCDELGIPRDRAHYVMDKWGYTGSALPADGHLMMHVSWARSNQEIW